MSDSQYTHTYEDVEEAYENGRMMSKMEHAATIGKLTTEADDLRRQLAELKAQCDLLNKAAPRLIDLISELERANAALTQRVAETWQPVEDELGIICNGDWIVDQLGTELRIFFRDKPESVVDLPFDIRLCQRRPQAQEKEEHNAT